MNYRCSGGDNDIDFHLKQLGYEARDALVLTFQIASFDDAEYDFGETNVDIDVSKLDAAKAERISYIKKMPKTFVADLGINI